MVKRSSSASGFYTAVHSLRPFYSLGVPAAWESPPIKVYTASSRLQWGWRTWCAPTPFCSPGLHVGERREVARAPRRSQVLGRRTRQGATLGRASPTRAPLRFPRRPPDLKAALRTRGWVRRRSGPSPTPHRQERTAPGAPWPGSTSPLTGSHRGRRKDRPVRNTQASPTRTLNGRSPTPPGPPLFGCSEPWGHASDLRAREPPEARRRQSAACRFADSALALSRALSLGQWGYPQSRGRLHRSGGAAVSSGRCLAAILCVAEAGLLVD